VQQISGWVRIYIGSQISDSARPVSGSIILWEAARISLCVPNTWQEPGSTVVAAPGIAAGSFAVQGFRCAAPNTGAPSTAAGRSGALPEMRGKAHAGVPAD
jgi:hypothetical protein